MQRLLQPILFAVALTAGHSAAAADADHPTVVEIFQSQGCSSCPPANANVMALDGRPEVLTLSFGVTYWDQLGWKDTFASPAYTARQWDYAHALKRSEVFTPQVVVNGRTDGTGVNAGELARLIRAGDRGAGGPSLSQRNGEILIGASPVFHGAAEVWLVRYDPKVIQVAIRRGENGGHTLPHRNVVRSLRPLGAWRGGKLLLPLPHFGDDGLRSAVLVQVAHGGPILAAARVQG